MHHHRLLVLHCLVLTALAQSCCVVEIPCRDRLSHKVVSVSENDQRSFDWYIGFYFAVQFW